MEIGYNSQYEHYTQHDYRKQRKIPKTKFYINMNIILFIVTLVTPFVLLGNYCFNNFDIDLEKEYADYTDIGEKRIDDLMFGKKNVCQYLGSKFYNEILSFKNFQISILFYVSIIIIIIFILIFTGFMDDIFQYIKDGFLKLYNNKNEIFENFKNMELIKGSTKVYKCFGESYYTSKFSQKRNKKLKDTATLQRAPDNFFTKLIKSF